MGAFNITLTTHFTTTAIDDDDTHVITAGSTTVSDTIAAASGLYYDKRFSIASTATEIWSDSITADFDFLWIESDTSNVEIQLMCNEGGTLSGNNIENAFVVKLTEGIPLVLTKDDSRNMGNMDGTFGESQHQDEIDNWETHWLADTIDRIEAYLGSGTANVRIFVAT